MTISRGAALKAARRQVGHAQSVERPGVFGAQGAACQYKVKSRTGPSPGVTPATRPGLAKARAPLTRDLTPSEKRTLPRSIQQCANLVGGRSALAVWMWRRSDFEPTEFERHSYCCGSYKCRGERYETDREGRERLVNPCARYSASVLFSRMRQAITRDEYDARGWVVLVLTLDRDGYYSGKPWADALTAYRALGKMTARFLEALRRDQKRNGERRLTNAWANVVEQHRSGWPHVNLVLYAPELARRLEVDQAVRRARGQNETDARLIEGRLLELATRAGWGVRSTAEAVRSREALSSYLVKVAGDADRHVGELAKLTQRPINAPFRFRRLRSGKGFLPPKKKSDIFTGTMVVRYRRADTPTCSPVQSQKREKHRATARASELEELLLAYELAKRKPTPPFCRVSLTSEGLRVDVPRRAEHHSTNPSQGENDNEREPR